jgi:choice-of-anchor B domain-containing protein
MKVIFLPIFIFFSSIASLLAQYNISFASQLEYADSINLSGCWGYTADDGGEYALVGTTHGTSIVNITNPATSVELFFIGGPISTWREARTWNHHAYITTEGGGGLLIIDLTDLPASIDTISFTGTVDHPLTTAHTIFIDEYGVAYLFGYNVLTGATEGAYMVDLNADPKHPEYLGELTSTYIHDGYARNDTLWAACINEGNIQVFDVSDKSNPVLLGLQPTSANAAHNCWLSDDAKYLFTTDEIWTGFISSFDVTDVTDIKQLDVIKHGDKDSTIAHNTYYLNGYLVSSHYSEGLTIHDASKPDNLVEIAHYDTSPFGPEAFFEGAWGVYPYLPSGNIIISDIGDGLVVLTPTYQRACYLEGTVYDDVSFNAIVNAFIQIVDTEILDSTNIVGEFKVGYYQEGTYDVIISKDGCDTKTITDVELIAGTVTPLDVLLDCGTIGIPDNDIDENVVCYFNALTDAIQLGNYKTTSVQVTIYNVEGKQVASIIMDPAQETIFETAALPDGVYVVTFDHQQSKKLVIY